MATNMGTVGSHPGSARTSAECSLASSRESSTTTVPYKVIMLGAAGVGKTSLVSQFMTSEYLHAYDNSLGKSYQILFNIQYWHSRIKIGLLSNNPTDIAEAWLLKFILNLWIVQNGWYLSTYLLNQVVFLEVGSLALTGSSHWYTNSAALRQWRPTYRSHMVATLPLYVRIILFLFI